MDDVKAEQLPIRLWWGFKRKDIGRADLLEQLRSVFLPATVQVMHRRLGALSAYLPVVLPDHGCIGVPDEMALVVYRSLEQYQAAMETLEGRAYQLLHQAVFQSPSSSNGFPVRFAHTLECNQPYFLWSRSDQWMESWSTVLVGRRPVGLKKAHFLEGVQQALVQIQQRQHEDNTPSAVLVRATSNVVSYFEMWTGNSIPNANTSNILASKVKVHMRSGASPHHVPFELNEAGKSWLSLSGEGEFINLQF